MSTAASAAAPPAFLARERGRVDRALATIAGEAVAGARTPLVEAIGYALETPGKRIRPILCVLAYRAAGGVDRGPVYRLACSLELIHTYSLIHDDLPCMDDDDMRRGRATLHRMYGASLAVLAGASLIPLGFSVLDRSARELRLGAGDRTLLAATLAGAAGAGGMVAGQLLDLEAEGREVDAAGLERIHRAKTGSLLAAALRMGALASGADERRQGALASYGRHFGLAFQITDDLLDVEGNSAELGKRARRDQALAKATYPALFGVAGARRRAEEHSAGAVAALRGAGMSSPQLEALAEYVIRRRS
ncbi:MAG: polyprenyl synthetase family protein [Longimicrobiaceae bacterium]